jgi:DnaJ family protein B protein 12
MRRHKDFSRYTIRTTIILSLNTPDHFSRQAIRPDSPTATPVPSVFVFSSSHPLAVMEVNKEEALRCLAIAQRHRSSSNFPSALKFAKKSVSLYSTPEGEALVTIIEREITVSSSTSTSTSGSSSPAPTPNEEAGPSGAGSRSRATASGVEEHMTSAHARPGHAPKSGATAAGAGGGSGAAAAGSGSDKGKKREYTVKQMEVVKRVKTCQHHQYYEILAGEWLR